jgi:hypothetical protein
MNDIFKDLILPSDEEIKRETHNLKLSISHKGKPGVWTNKKHKSESKKLIGVAGKGRVPPNKGKEMPEQSIDANTDFIYFTPGGIFTQYKQLLKHYESTFTHNNLKYWTTISRNGFSRMLKEEYAALKDKSWRPPQTKSELPVYVYYTPKGQFNSLSECAEAYKGEATQSGIRSWITRGKPGFYKIEN